MQFSLTNHVDESWRVPDLEQLLLYLKSSPIAIAAQEKQVKCGLCHESISLSCYRSDGEWLWTDSLAHLVEKHFFVLPDTLVRHIRDKNYKQPTTLSIPIDKLPWPQITSDTDEIGQ
jgi:hypothetical protein